MSARKAEVVGLDVLTSKCGLIVACFYLRGLAATRISIVQSRIAFEEEST